jgi:hypothetical protein
MNEVLRQHAKLWMETNQTNTIHANDFIYKLSVNKVYWKCLGNSRYSDEWMNESGNPSYLILLSTMKEANLWIF